MHSSASQGVRLTQSARSSLSPEKQGGTRRDGRTPPPPVAPSAAYAKRAREIQDSDGMQVPLSEEQSSPSAVQRRARAGTMPSTFYDGRSPDTEPPEVDESLVQARTSALSPAYSQVTPSRPILRHTHTASSVARLETPTTANVNANANRLRAGSLTMPEGGLGNGSSPFGNGWLSAPMPNNGPSQSPLGNGAMEQLLPLEGPATDDFNSTLDYLGLADGTEQLMPPASMSEMRSQAQQAIAQSGPASRNRASTVSNFARPYRQSVTETGPYSRDHTAYSSGRSPEEELAQAIEVLGMYDSGYLSHPQIANLYSSLKDPHRSRATTIGALDNPMRRGGSRNMGYLSSIPQSPVQANMNHNQTMYGSYGYGQAPRSRSDRDFTRSRDSSVSHGHGPRHSISSHTSRTGTPDFDKLSSTPQMPTRSLWIGNLDVSATSDGLFEVFSPYGGIESVRLLPEKTCAFVNFMDRSDAVRARDDVLNRLGGHVALLSETAPIRIGFGKIDAAPTGPPLSAPQQTTPGVIVTNGSTGGVTLPPALEGATEQHAELSTLPTRALWVGSIPGTTSSATLLQIFSPFGPVESARVLMAKCCGFINFERLDSAVSARNALNGRDILGSDVGPIKIGFARVPTKSPMLGGPDEGPETPGHLGQMYGGLDAVEGATAVSTEQQMSVEAGGLENYRSPLVLEMVKNGVHEQVMEKGLASGGVVSEQQMIMQVLSGGRLEEDRDVKAAAEFRPPVTYYTSIANTLERPSRRFDAAMLKEVRRRLDSGQCSQEEIDELTVDMTDEAAELAADYIGNTVIQKLFERTSPPLRIAMLQRIAPHIATIGVHKNGTWAVQKIIECSVTPEERSLVVSNLRAFAPPLMCDSLGNYVCAGTLKFGTPHNEYVFDAMIDRMWDIAQNRFGARCMRTCLESPSTPLYQKKRIATAVILNSIPLATNPNGALLLTWLVEQSSLPGRYGLLANRFAPHIAHLCTHKLASLTVLRIITQTSETQASTAIINAIFHSPQDVTLMEVLADANNGAQVIGKILAIASIPADEKTGMVEAVRLVLPTIKGYNTPPYRLLLEALGLPVPPSALRASPMTMTSRPGPGQGNMPPWQQQQRQPQYPHHQQQQRGQQNTPPQQYGFYQYNQPMPTQTSPIDSMMGGGMNLSPLLVPQNMPIGQMRGGSGQHQGYQAGGYGSGGGMGGTTPNPNLTPRQDRSPRTPIAHPRGRMDMHHQMQMQHQMMSPASDPFNPFASPSIDLPYMQQQQNQHQPMRLSSQLGQQVTTFEQQPNVGGLGILGDSAAGGEGGVAGGVRGVSGGRYYQQNPIRPGAFAGAGFRN